MTKFVSVVAGTAFGVYLDARRGSPTFGQVVTVELELGTAVVVSSGICNGFQATGEGVTQYAYCFDQEWGPAMDGVAVNPFDPELAIAWPIPIDRSDRSLLSEKDATLLPLRR
jgi:dTDP-4-dehydrorhamnose 3,5-epimerase